MNSDIYLVRYWSDYANSSADLPASRAHAVSIRKFVSCSLYMTRGYITEVYNRGMPRMIIPRSAKAAISCNNEREERERECERDRFFLFKMFLSIRQAT